MKNLDDTKGIQKLDPLNTLQSINLLGKQCRQSWDEVASLAFPQGYKQASNIAFFGMGGSALGAYVIKSLYLLDLRIPMEIINDYHIPGFVNEHTLVLLGSYSGSTEEPVHASSEAQAKKSMITGFAEGKDIVDFFVKNKYPFFRINPVNNPSGQPRLGTGYTMFSQIAILAKLGYIKVTPEELQETLEVLENGPEKFGVTVKTESNEAKLLARELIDFIPVIFSAEFLTHVGRVMRNQINENAKSFAGYHDIPELNHHLLEGFSHPAINKDVIKVLFYSSPLYTEKIQRRIEITKQVLFKQNISFYEFIPQAKTKLAQVFETIQFGAYTTFYMAMLYGTDPSKIPYVDFFKSELAKS